MQEQKEKLSYNSYFTQTTVPHPVTELSKRQRYALIEEGLKELQPLLKQDASLMTKKDNMRFSRFIEQVKQHNVVIENCEYFIEKALTFYKKLTLDSLKKLLDQEKCISHLLIIIRAYVELTVYLKELNSKSSQDHYQVCSLLFTLISEESKQHALHEGDKKNVEQLFLRSIELINFDDNSFSLQININNLLEESDIENSRLTQFRKMIMFFCLSYQYNTSSNREKLIEFSQRAMESLNEINEGDAFSSFTLPVIYIMFRVVFFYSRYAKSPQKEQALEQALSYKTLILKHLKISDLHTIWLKNFYTLHSETADSITEDNDAINHHSQQGLVFFHELVLRNECGSEEELSVFILSANTCAKTAEKTEVKLAARNYELAIDGIKMFIKLINTTGKKIQALSPMYIYQMADIYFSLLTLKLKVKESDKLRFYYNEGNYFLNLFIKKLEIKSWPSDLVEYLASLANRFKLIANGLENNLEIKWALECLDTAVNLALKLKNLQHLKTLVPVRQLQLAHLFEMAIESYHNQSQDVKAYDVYHKSLTFLLAFLMVDLANQSPCKAIEKKDCYSAFSTIFKMMNENEKLKEQCINDTKKPFELHKLIDCIVKLPIQECDSSLPTFNANPFKELKNSLESLMINTVLQLEESTKEPKKKKRNKPKNTQPKNETIEIIPEKPEETVIEIAPPSAPVEPKEKRKVKAYKKPNTTFFKPESYSTTPLYEYPSNKKIDENSSSSETSEIKIEEPASEVVNEINQTVEKESAVQISKKTTLTHFQATPTISLFQRFGGIHPQALFARAVGLNYKNGILYPIYFKMAVHELIARTVLVFPRPLLVINPNLAIDELNKYSYSITLAGNGNIIKFENFTELWKYIHNLCQSHLEAAKPSQGIKFI